MSEAPSRAVENPIRELLRRKRAKDLVVPGLLSGAFLLTFTGAAFKDRTLPLMVALFGLPLLHLLLCLPVFLLPRLLQRKDRAADLLAAPLESQLFVEAFHHVFWRVTAWCAAVASVALLIYSVFCVLGYYPRPPFTSPKEDSIDFRYVVEFALVTGTALVIVAWTIFWNLVRSLGIRDLIPLIALAIIGVLAGLLVGALLFLASGIYMFEVCRSDYLERLREKLFP